MKRFINAAVASLIVLVSQSAEAQNFDLDLTDGSFIVLQDSGIASEPVIFSESAGTATLTFESTANLVGITRFVNFQPMQSSNGIQLGGGGGSTLAFTLSSNVDTLLNSYTGNGIGGITSPTFDVSGLGVSSVGNAIPIPSSATFFSGGPLLLQANQDYTFNVTNSGAVVQGWISSFNLTVVPEPSAALLVMLASLAAGVVRRRV